MGLQEVKDLIEFINKTDIGEVVLESPTGKVVIRKSGNGILRAVKNEEAIFRPKEIIPEKKSQVQELKYEGAVSVKAPLVGTFYRKSSPEAPPYVEVGDMVKKGQVLCIIEAMKMMNEIKSEVDGEIVGILAEDGDLVNCGDELFLIKETVN